MILKKSYLLTVTLSIISCTNINQSENNPNTNIKNVFVSEKSGPSIKVYVKDLVNKFSAKTSLNGSDPILTTSADKIRIVLSTDPDNTFDNPVNINTTILLSGTFPQSVNFNNLATNKIYYIAAKAYSNIGEIPTANITEGGVYVSPENISVDSSGTVSIIPTDTGIVGNVDVNVPLKNEVLARVDSNISINSGTLGDFKTKEQIIISELGADKAEEPRIDMDNEGNGLVVAKKLISGEKFLGQKYFFDYTPNDIWISTPSDLIDASNPSVMGSFSISLNDKRNGFGCWNLNDDMKLKHIKNLEKDAIPPNTIDVSTNLNSKCDFKIKKLSPSDVGIAVWLEQVSVNSEIRARGVISSDEFDNFTLSSGSFSLTSGFNDLSPVVSEIDENNQTLLVWNREIAVNNNVIKSQKQLVNNVSGFVNSSGSGFDIATISDTVSNLSLSLDKKGSGFIFWQEGSPSKIAFKRIENYEPIGITKYDVGQLSNSLRPRVKINSQGSGFVVWENSGDIYGSSIYKYNISKKFSIVNDTLSSCRNPDLSIDEKGNGYVVWERGVTNPISVYGKRIYNYDVN